MPIYEYTAIEDNETVEALRPMADADKPLADPAGKGRTFVRKQSTFAAKGTAIGASLGGSAAGSGCCPCSKVPGACSRPS